MQSWMRFYNATHFNGKMTKLLKPRGFKMEGLCSQTTLLPGCAGEVSLERRPQPAMELRLQRHRLTISSSKWTGVGFMALLSLLCLETDRAIRDSALIWSWEMKLCLYRHEQASLQAPTPLRDSSILVCGAKSTGWQRAGAIRQPYTVVSCSLDSFTPPDRKTCGNHWLQRLLWSPLQHQPCRRHARIFGTCRREWPWHKTRDSFRWAITTHLRIRDTWRDRVIEPYF